MKNYILAITGLLTIIAGAQTTTFDNLNANPLTNKAITWNSSNYGSGFGHRLINSDPGGQTLLNFQGRHNSTNWADIMTLTSSGKVGIGTTYPNSLLELKSPGRTELTISGDGVGVINSGLVLKAYNSNNYRGLGTFMYDIGGQTEWFAGRPYAGSDKFVIYRRDNLTNHDTKTASLVHNTSNSETKSLFVLNNNGNLGLGTTNPTAKLHVIGNLNTTDHINAAQYISVSKGGSYRIAMNGQGHGYITGRNDNVENKFHIHSNGNSFFNGGNVGIGTSNPSQKFEVYNTNAFNTSMENQSQDHISLISNDPGNGGFFGGITWKSSGRRRAAIAATREHTDSDHVGLAFFTRGTDGPGPIYESMRITRYGKVGIGTTAPDAKLTVKGDIHAEEVKIDLSVPAPDYVFTKDYDLLTIEEVQEHIAAQGSLT